MVPKERLFHCLYLGFWDNAAISASFKCDISFQYDGGGDLVINWCYEQHFSFHNSVNFQATGSLNPQYNFHIIKPHTQNLTHTKHSQQWQTEEKNKAEKLDAKSSRFFSFFLLYTHWTAMSKSQLGLARVGRGKNSVFHSLRFKHTWAKCTQCHLFMDQEHVVHPRGEGYH